MEPSLIINPNSDKAFVRRVHEIARDLQDGPEELTETLREDYPNARVRRRGLSDEDDETWYVYREGVWVQR